MDIGLICRYMLEEYHFLDTLYLLDQALAQIKTFWHQSLNSWLFKLHEKRVHVERLPTHIVLTRTRK